MSYRETIKQIYRAAITELRTNRDLAVSVLIGLFAILISQLTLAGAHFLIIIRWILGFAFIFFIAGYPLTVLFYPSKNSLHLYERAILSSGFSLLMLYPAGILNIILEGQTDIYRIHLTGLMSVLTVFTFICACITYLIRRRGKLILNGGEKSHGKKSSKKIWLFLLLILAISCFLNFYNLGRPDVCHDDEIQMGYKSYDLVDGMFVGRKAYCLSFQDHCPLTLFINHASMQILEPRGFYFLDDWMLRVSMAFIGVLTVFLAYLFASEIFNSKTTGLIAALILAVSNYAVWTSRIFMRESFLPFFMLLSLYFFHKYRTTKGRREAFLSGVFLGAAMLVQVWGIILAFAYLAYCLLQDRKMLVKTLKITAVGLLVFSPVIVYNVAAYVTTGYMDIAFARVAAFFGVDARPSGVGGDIYGGGLFLNVGHLANLLCTFIDLYSIPLFMLFVIGTLGALYFTGKRDKGSTYLLSLWILITILILWAFGFRAYYMPYITAPFAILTGYFLNNLIGLFRKREKKFYLTAIILPGLVLSYSAFYSYNTNLASHYTYRLSDTSRFIEHGMSTYPILTPSLEYHFSRVTRGWSETWGFKDLREFMEKNLQENDLLVVDDNIRAEDIRWYLKVADPIMTYYLKENYKTKSDYIFLSNLENTSTAGYNIVWVVTFKPAVGGYSLIKVIRDLSGRPTLYVHRK